MTERYKRKPNTRCVVCKKQVYKRPGEIKENVGRVFCSMVCYGISCRKEKPCIVCGKLILSGLHKKTCSRKCSNVNRAGIKYKIGGLSDKVKSQQALKVRLLHIRDNKCGRCSYNKIEVLQVHHKDHNRKNNNIENLELVCPNCHYEEHYLNKKLVKKIKLGRCG